VVPPQILVAVMLMSGSADRRGSVISAQFVGAQLAAVPRLVGGHSVLKPSLCQRSANETVSWHMDRVLTHE